MFKRILGVGILTLLLCTASVSEEKAFEPCISGGGGGSSENHISMNKLYLYELPEAPNIDGNDAESAWDALDWVRCSDTWGVGCSASTDDLSCRFKIGHYGHSLFLFLEVTDDQIDDNPENCGLERDYAAVFMDLESVGGFAFSSEQQALDWESVGGPAWLRFHDNGIDQTVGGMTPIPENTTNFATNITVTGKIYYEIELRLPISALALPSYTLFGFGLKINDADGNDTEDSVGWLGGFEQPWGDYNICENAVPQVRASDYAKAGIVTMAGDMDGDGLSTGDEITLGTNFDDTDSDNDGLTDYEEVYYDGNVGYAAGADTDPLNPDTDGDGAADGMEFTLGTNPLDSGSFPELDVAGIACHILLFIILMNIAACSIRRKCREGNA